MKKSEIEPVRTAADMEKLLRERFKAPEWALLFGVRSRTGYGGAIRTADAVAMSLWPSRGMELHGVEVKVSRSDWIREKDEPAKAEEICRFCDRWWLAVGREDIVQPGELPPTWGLLVPGRGGLVVKAEAPKLEPQAFTRAFLAGLLRNVTADQANRISRSEIRSEIDAECAKVREQYEADFKRRTESMRETIENFERESGVQLQRWIAGDIGKAVRTVLGNRHEDPLAMLERLAGVAKSISDDLALRVEQAKTPKIEPQEF